MLTFIFYIFFYPYSPHQLRRQSCWLKVILYCHLPAARCLVISYTTCRRLPWILTGSITYFSVIVPPTLSPHTIKLLYILSKPLRDVLQYIIHQVFPSIWAFYIYHFPAALVGLRRSRPVSVASIHVRNEEYPWSCSTCLFCLVHFT